ncbi:MAG: IS21 family transposase [Candidatus Sabulitectum sp.]|nr:IS21 family transposase [Candidatus Sabulitectum sp.]
MTETVSESRIHVNDVIDIIYRLRNGQSQRLISKETGIGRKTIRKYFLVSEKNGWLSLEVPLPELDLVSEKLSERKSEQIDKNQKSSLEPYREVITDWLKEKYNRKRILHLLRSNFDMVVSYDTVKRYCRYLLDNPAAKAVVRLETDPGEVAQVDFGEVTKCYRNVPKGIRIYIFIMTLGASRHQYVEHVFDQKMATWLRCHERAFAFFGGVIRKVVIDNLKAAVIRIIYHDPVLSLPYKRLARHYGFMISPCAPRTPEHKGKVEKNVDYVKGAFCNGENWTDLADMNLKIRRWAKEVAGTRIHGTIKQKPIEVFREVEQKELKPLPAQPLNYTTASRKKLPRDLHIDVDDNWYSAPFEHMGKRLDIYAEGKLVRIYRNSRLIATHTRALGKGQRVTNMMHYPEHKRFWTEHPPIVCLVEAGKLGNSIFLLVNELLEDKVQDHLSSVHKLLALEGKYGKDRLEKACERARHYHDPSYICVKRILLAGTESDPLEKESDLIPVSMDNYEYARKAHDLFVSGGVQ